jgi:hypothetical protein
VGSDTWRDFCEERFHQRMPYSLAGPKVAAAGGGTIRTASS